MSLLHYISSTYIYTYILVLIQLLILYLHDFNTHYKYSFCQLKKMASATVDGELIEELSKMTKSLSLSNGILNTSNSDLTDVES